MMLRSLLLVTLLCFGSVYCDDTLKFLTFNTSPNDGTKRFLWSAKTYGIEVDVIEDPGSHIRLSVVSERIRLLEPKTNVLFCNSKFLAIGGSSQDILERWRESGSDVLLALESAAPLQLICILGKSPDVLLITKKLIEIGVSLKNDINTFFNEIESEAQLKISQDKESKVFLKMDDSDNVGYTEDRQKFVNFETMDTPPVLIGSVKSYNLFTRLTNHVPDVFDLKMIRDGKRASKKMFRPWDDFRVSKDAHSYFTSDDNLRYTTLVSALFIKEDVPFLDLVLNRFKSLQWLSSKRVILIFNRVSHRDHVVNHFLSNMKSRSSFLSIEFFNSTTKESKTNLEMHKKVNETCNKFDCMWVWNQDSDVMNIQGSMLNELAIFNVSIISPLTLSDLYSDDPRPNFWGDTAPNGFYKRSADYFDITQGKIGGLFVVPYAKGGYLVRASVLKELSYHDPLYKDEDSDIVFSNSVRKSGHYFFLKADRSDCMFINGRTNSSVKHPFLEHFEDNKTPFQLGYFMKWNHTRIRDVNRAELNPQQNPCVDVFIMDIFSEEFARNLKAAALSSSSWSFKEWFNGWDILETVPLSDLGYENGWKVFSETYITTGIYQKFNRFESAGTTISSFVVRMTNESTPTGQLEGLGVYTVVVALTGDSSFGSLIFNGVCRIKLNVGDLVVFPSRMTHRINFDTPKNGTSMYLVSFH